MLMVRDTSFYRRLVTLVIPIALQSMITHAVSLADNVMVGSLGEIAISGVYVASQIQSFYMMIIIGLGATMGVLATQYWGKGDRRSVVQIIGIAMKIGLGIAVTLLLVMFFMPRPVLGLFTDDEAVISEALSYIRIFCFTYVFFCITNVLISAFRCVEKVRIGLLISSITLVVNIALNWVLIFGHFGFPALGVVGAAIATLVARALETVIVIVYAWRYEKQLRLRFRELFDVHMPLLRDFFKYGLPVILGDLFWGVNITIQGMIIGHLGADVIAAASISNVVFSIVGVFVYGTANASAVIIGQTVGSGNVPLVKQYARTLQILFLIVGLATGLLLFLVKDPILSLYHISPASMTLARQFMLVLCVTIVGTAYQMSSLTGIVRAGGATHFVLYNDLIFVWGVVIPSALIAAFVLHAPAWVVFACLKSDQVLKCAVAVVKVNRFRWIKNLTREWEGAPKPAESA